MSQATRSFKMILARGLVVLYAALINQGCSDHQVQDESTGAKQAGAVSQSAVEQPFVVDHLDEFRYFVELIAAAEDPQAIRAIYREHFVSRDPELYAAFVGDINKISDSLMKRIANAWLEHTEDILEYRTLALEQIPDVTAKAAEVYGASLAYVPQFITLNLMKSNAQVRLPEGQITIFYGMDTNAQMEDIVFPTVSRDLRSTIAHELFHAHHWKENAFMKQWAPRFLPPKSDAPLWINLWSEGLANCAVRHVYPNANIDHIMAFEGVWDEGQSRMGELAARIKVDLEATDAEAAAKWLFLEMPERSDGLPNKAGYIVGTAVADHIVSELGLGGATALKGAALRKAFFDTVDGLADGDLVVEGTTLCRAGSPSAE